MNPTIHKLTTFLILFGALNWGMVGVFGVDLVVILFGTTVLTKLMYVFIGLSALIHIITDLPKTIKS